MTGTWQQEEKACMVMRQATILPHCIYVQEIEINEGYSSFVFSFYLVQDSNSQNSTTHTLGESCNLIEKITHKCGHRQI